MIRCIIIDDEPNNRDDLKSLIEYKFKDRISVLEMCGSVDEGVKLINQTMPDLVFLDIRMPGQDGFSLFGKFDHILFEVVFTTAYEEYAIQAIRHAAFDYLIKPVAAIDIEAFLKRYQQKSETKSIEQKVKLLLSELQRGPDTNVLISLPMGKEYKVLNTRDIVFCKADVNYTEIHLTGNTKILVTMTLGKVSELLDFPFFFRCHKSYLVNLDHIDTYNKIDGYITMKAGETIYLANRRIEDFINIFRHTR